METENKPLTANRALTESDFEAVRLLGVFTNGHFDVWQLAGASKVKIRTGIMSVIRRRKATQRESGVNDLREAFDVILCVRGETLAERGDNLAEYAKRVLADNGYTENGAVAEVRS